MSDLYKAIKEKKKAPVLKNQLLKLLDAILKSDEDISKEKTQKIAQVRARIEILLEDL